MISVLLKAFDPARENRFDTGRSVLGAAMVVAALGLTGCGAMSGMVSKVTGLFSSEGKPVKPNWKSLVITAADDANLNSAVALDLVFVTDKAVVDALLKTTSGKWFATRREIERTFPDSVVVKSLELAPRQSVKFGEQVLASNKALAAIVFADYPGPGEHRATLAMHSAGYVVQLGARGFNVAEVKGP
jgi:type VI secretion system protein